MSARGRQALDDLNLSLAGSGIHSAASSSRSRPGSAKQLKRPNSVTDVSKEVFRLRKVIHVQGNDTYPRVILRICTCV